MCGLLKRCMYGTRDAANRWEAKYTGALLAMGFRQGKASPCCFRHPQRDLKCVVHGDDFTLLGPTPALEWFKLEFAKHFDLKDRGTLGPDRDDMKEIRILNRILRWTSTGLEYEADQRHAEILVQRLGLEQSRSVNTPGLHERESCRVRCGSAGFSPGVTQPKETR